MTNEELLARLKGHNCKNCEYFEMRYEDPIAEEYYCEISSEGLKHNWCTSWKDAAWKTFLGLKKTLRF
jgi:ribosome maturation factor RimP